MNYHAHIYWTDQISRAMAIGMREHLDELGCTLGPIRDRRVGPHALPMYQAEYHDLIQPDVEAFLSENADGISILLHEDTGQHLADHTTGARWIGIPLALDIDLLRRLDAGEDE